MNIDELKPGASNDPDDWCVAGPDFGDTGLPPGMASRIADAIMAEPDTYGMHVDDKGVVKHGQRRNRHLNGDGYGEGR